MGRHLAESYKKKEGAFTSLAISFPTTTQSHTRFHHGTRCTGTADYPRVATICGEGPQLGGRASFLHVASPSLESPVTQIKGSRVGGDVNGW